MFFWHKHTWVIVDKGPSDGLLYMPWKHKQFEWKCLTV